MKKKTKVLNVWSLILNLIIIGGSLAGLILSGLFAAKQGDLSPNMFMQYSIIAGIITILSSFLMMFANVVNVNRGHDTTPRLFFTLRMISAVMSTITLLLSIYVFLKMTERNPYIEEFILYIGVPAVSLIEFVFCELEPVARFKKTFAPFVFTLLYIVGCLGAIAVVYFTKGAAAANKIIPEGYDMFRLMKDLIPSGGKLANNAIALAVFVVGSYLVSLLVWGLNRIISSLVVGVDSKAVTRREEKQIRKEAPNAEEEKNERVTKRVTKYVKKKASFNFAKKEELENAVYHVSYANRRNKTWKVKAENTDKAIKVFPTQAEAIEFANQLIAENGGSIRIHSVTGRIRREW